MFDRAPKVNLPQNTTLNWIISGPIAALSASEPSSEFAHGIVLEALDRDLRFWEKRLPQKPPRSLEEQHCDKHFRATHSRISEGYYVVRLPFKNGPPVSLGDSHSAAISSLYHMKQLLKRDLINSLDYRDFLAEYKSLSHMTKSLLIDIDKLDQSYYIPHHAVLRNSSVTTRLRVVFNASCRMINGMSLNDYMLIGPKFQRDLAIVAIMRWRQNGYVFISDIVKMYRQIFVDIRDIDYQRIMWSFPSKSISEYYLLTVIYGTAAASYLTLRVLGQLMEDEGSEFLLVLSDPVLRHQKY